MIFDHLRRSFRETFPARASEWALSVILLNWSAVLMFNDTLFRDGASYRFLAQVAHQETWAWLCFMAAGSRLVVLGINGAWRRSPHARAAFAFMASFFWFQITIGFIQAGTFSTGLAVYPVLLALDSYNVLRAMGEAGIIDNHHKRRATDNADSG